MKKVMIGFVFLTMIILRGCRTTLAQVSSEPQFTKIPLSSNYDALEPSIDTKQWKSTIRNIINRIQIS
jgi:hypothetical protein